MFIIALNYDRNDPNEINARAKGSSNFMVPMLLEHALEKHPEVTVYRGDEVEAGISDEDELITRCDLMINSMPMNRVPFRHNTRGGLTAWWDLEECSDPKREFYEPSQIVFHPNYNPYQWHLYPKDKASYLPLANDFTVSRYFPEEEKIYDVAFLGREELEIYERRRRLLDLLQNEGFKVRRGAVPRGELSSREISKGYLTIQVSGWDNLEERFFQFGAIRPILVDYLEENDLVAKRDVEYISYETDDEFLEKVRYYLSHSEEAEKIYQAQVSNIEKNHTYNNRAEEIVRILKGGELDRRGWYLWDKAASQRLTDPRNPGK